MDIELLLEAERRGILPDDKKALLDEARRRGLVPGGASEEADMSFGGRVWDNVRGVDDGVESAGEKLGNYIRGATAAVARGMADVPAVPANIAQLATSGVEKAVGMDEPSAVSRALDSLPDTRDMLASVPVIGPESQYRAPGTAGEYISTIGEFAGGAGAMSGPGAMLRYGALPGATSEAAGQATEGTSLEPWARVGAALLTPAITAKRAPTTRAPSAGRLRSAQRLEASGVKPTAGQVADSDILRRVEGTAEATGRQIDDFTAAAMRRIKSDAAEARPEALRSAQKAIVKRIDDAVSGVDVRVPRAIRTNIDDAMKRYERSITAGNRSNIFNNLSDELSEFASSGKTVPLSQLREWRSEIGRLTTSADDVTRETAHNFRRMIDEMTEQALRDAGRADDILNLRIANNDYRNFLAVEDAATRAGATSGKISPQQLNQAIIRTQGRKNYATGRGTEMMEFARSGDEILRPMPTVSPGASRTLEGAAQLGGGAIGYQVAGWPGAAVGAAAPLMVQGLSRTPAVQNAFRNPMSAMRPIPPMLPGLLSTDER